MNSKKDWKGNSKSMFVTLGASNHAKYERQQHDYYATDPKAAELLLQHETFEGAIWEPACGEKHLSKVFENHGFTVRSSDLIQRCDCEQLDFLSMDAGPFDGNIVTNPPYRYATEFVRKSIRLIPEGKKVAIFLRIQFLEGKERRELFRITPPKVVYVFSRRINCAINGQFTNRTSSPATYAWFVWVKGWKGEPVIRWI
ncbi:MAG: hypothetical protein ACI36Z_01400 [Alloprevotella sp.]